MIQCEAKESFSVFLHIRGEGLEGVKTGVRLGKPSGTPMTIVIPVDIVIPMTGCRTFYRSRDTDGI